MMHCKSQKENRFSGLRSSLFFLLFFLVLSLNNTFAEAINEVTADSSEVYNMVDQMPEIKGGVESIYEHISYPSDARRSGIEGRVFIRFIVNKDGNVEKPEILRDIGGGCGEEAVEAIKKVEFTPGRHEGEKVNVRYSLPVTFKLEN